MGEYEFNEDGSLKIIEQVQKKRELAHSALNALLASEQILIGKLVCISEKLPAVVELSIKVPNSFNMRILESIFFETKKSSPPYAKNCYYNIDSNTFSIVVRSGSHMHSFIRSFLENIDNNVDQEIMISFTDYHEWIPKFKEKLPRNEFERIVEIIQGL